MIKLLHFLYWFLIFNVGTTTLLGIPSVLWKIGIPFLSILLFFNMLFFRQNIIKKPFIGWIFAFILIAILSKILNGIETISLIQFLFITLSPYIYLLVIINERKIELINSITKWVVILILIQIPAAIVKYFILGQSEKGAIGTMSLGDGSLSTVFPLLIIAFLISFHQFTNKKKYFVLIILFILFGVIGLKRAIVFLIPVEFLIGYILYLSFFTEKIDLRRVKKMIFISLSALFAFYILVRTNPTLNKEHKIWGSFNYNYLMEYTLSYTSSEEEEKSEMRRADGLIYFINYNLNSNTNNLLLGDGVGILVGTSLNKQTGTMSQLYGIRYGGRMGVIWILLQIGLLGLIIYLGFLIHLNIYLWKNLPIINNYLLLGFVLATIFMLFDLIIYSPVFISLYVVSSIYYYVAALLYKGIYVLNNKNIQRIFLFNSLKFKK